MAAPGQRRRPQQHILSILGASVLFICLLSIHNAARLCNSDRNDDNLVPNAVEWAWSSHAVLNSGRDLAAASAAIAVHTNTTTEAASSLQHQDIHPWLVRQQAHPPKNPPTTTCKQQRQWHNNRTLLDESCFPLVSALACRLEPGMGPEGPDGAHLLQKIRPKYPSKRKRNPRILCLVYTNQENHALVETIVHTWGRKCDGFLAISDVNDASIGAIALPHDGPESYDNMWQKTRSILKYAHDHYVDDFDFFHVCGDDVYMVMQNMRDYLGSDEVIQLGKALRDANESITTYSQLEPLFLGAPMYMTNDWYACAGGSGYTLNQAALKLYATDIHDSCLVNKQSSQEDVHISECFWKLGVKCSGWNVRQRSTRYHGMDAQDQASGARSPLGGLKLRRFHGIKLAQGITGASLQSFAFHLKSIRFARRRHRNNSNSKSLRLFMMQRYDVIVNNLCPNHHHGMGGNHAALQ